MATRTPFPYVIQGKGMLAVLTGCRETSLPILVPAREHGTATRIPMDSVVIWWDYEAMRSMVPLPPQITACPSLPSQ